MKIVEPVYNDARGMLLALLVGGVTLAAAGVMALGIASDSGGVMRVIGWILLGVGGVMAQVAVIGFGVMLGVRAARP